MKPDTADTPVLSRTAFRSLLLAAASLAAPVAASGATLYWDGTDSTANADGGAGTWDAVATNWDTLATAGANSAWVDGSDASFAGTAGTVTVSGTFALNSLSIASAYTLTGGTLTLGGKTITTSGAGSSADIFINSILAGSGGLTLAANGDTTASGGGVGGSLRLGGANTFTGGVTITSGVVNIDSNFGDASNAITLNGGGLVDESTNTTFTRNLIIGASGGVIRNWGTTSTYTGGISGTGTLRRTDTGTQYYTGTWSGSVSLNTQRATTILSGNWLSTGGLTVDSGTTLSVSGQVYDGAAISNSGTLYFNAINRTNRTLAGTVGLGRAAALGTAATYGITSGATITSSAGALLDSARFAAGFVLTRNSVSSPTLLGSTAVNLSGNYAGRDPFYTGTYTLTGAFTTLGGGLGGFSAPNAAMNVNAQTIDIWGGQLWIGSLTGSGNINANGANYTGTGRAGEFPSPYLSGSASLAKAGAMMGRLSDASVVVGYNGASTTYSGTINNGSWSGGATSLLKVGSGTLTLTGGGGASGGIIVEQGTLTINRSGVGWNAGAYNASAVYAVLRGATLNINGDWNTANTNTLLVQGGTAAFNTSLAYVNNIILDGGTLGGTGGVRIGYFADSYINALATLGASTISKINLLDNSSARSTLSILVQDGAAARDLVATAGLNDDSAFPGLRINKKGLGTLAITGTSTRSGGTTITGGMLEVAAAGGLGSGATAGVTLSGGTLAIRYDQGGTLGSMAFSVGGGTLLLSGNTGAVTQAIGNLTVNNGNATFTASPGGGGSTTVSIGSITRAGSANRAFLNLDGTATWTTTQANDASGKLAGVLLGGGLAANNGSGGIVAYAGTQISGTAIADASATDYVIGASVTGNLTLAAAGTTTIGSLTLDSANGRTVDIGAGNTLRVVGPILQKTSGVALNFSNGTLTAGSANDTAADLYVSAMGGMAAGTGMSIGSVIANNGTGVVTLVKGGVGDLNLTSGANTYTGGTVINQGRLRVSGDAAIGGASGGAITVNDGGQLWATGSITKAITLNGGVGAYEAAGYLGAIRIESGVSLSGAVTVNNDSQVTTYGSATGTLSGAITLNGSMVKTGAGTLVLSNTTGGNGTLIIREGTVQYTGDYVNKSADVWIGSGARLYLTGVNSNNANLVTVAGGTYELASYHNKFTNVGLYGGTILGSAYSGGGKYNGEDAGFGTASTSVLVGGTATSYITTPYKIALNSTRFYVQDATGNAAPDLLVRGSFVNTGYLSGQGTTRFALQPLSQSGNTNHTANLYVAPGHTLEVAAGGAMGSGTVTLDGGTLRMTGIMGLAEYNISGGAMDTTSAGTLKGVTLTNQYHNTNNSGAFGGNTTWSYRGQLVIGGSTNRVVNFAENIDDAVWLKITGGPSNISTVVLNDSTWNATTYGSISLAPGTYTIDLRAWNGGGGAGWVSGLNGNGLAWDITTGAANTNSGSAAWTAVTANADANVQLWATGGLNQTLSNSVVLNSLSIVDVAGATDSVALTGVVSGAGMLWKTGSGALVLSAANTLSGGITVDGGELRIGAAGAQGSGAINLRSGSTLTYSGSANATFSNAIVAESGDAAISVWTAGTTLTLAQGLDNYTTGAATRTITKQGSGTLEIAGLLTGNHLYSVQGGTLLISAADASRASANVLASATLNVTASGSFGAVTNAGTATLSSTTLGNVTSSAGTLTANSATSTGAITLTGGAVTLGAATTVGNLSVAAGTLTANAATTSGTVTVSGTGTLNATALANSGAITVSGGTANLGAGSGYGATSLSNGTLNIGAATVASINKSGGTLNLGAVGTASTLSATGNSVLGGSLNFDLSSSTGSGNDRFSIGGTVDLSGLTGVVFNLTSGVLGTGSYTLVSSTGITNPSIGLGSVTKSGIVSGASRQTYTLSTTTVTNALTLDVAGSVGTNTWAASGNNNTWSTSSTDGSWVSTATDQWFYNADLVTFGDLTGVPARTVTVSGSVAPGSTTFTNTAATAYTLGGAGKITGTTGLTKSGNGRLVLGNTGGNDYTGTTTVSNGTLEVGAANALSTASALTVSGGSLDVAAVSNAAAGSVTLASGSIVGTTGSLSASSLTVTGGTLDANLSGTGSLTINGPGLSFAYGKTASHTGGTTLSSGSLTVAAGGSIAGAFTQSASTSLTVAGSLGGALSVATGSTTGISSGGNVVGNVTLVGNSTLTNAGTITGSLSLSNTSSATSSGTISGGFALANTASLTSTGAIAGGGTIAAGTSLNTSGTLAGNISNAGTLTFSGTTDRSYAGVISGSSAVYKTGSSTLTLTGASQGIGTLYLQGGRIVLNTGSGSTWNNTIGTASVTMSNGTVLEAANSTSLNGNLTIVGDASLQVNAGNTVWKDTSGSLGFGTSNATFRKTGAGTLVIATNRMAFGSGSTVVVDGGTLQLNMNIWGGGSIMGSAGLTVNSGGSVNITGYHVFDAYSGFVPVVNGGTITGNGQDVYIGGFNMTGGLVEKSRFVNVSAITTNAAATTAVYAANLSSGATTFSVADGAAAVDFRLDPYWNGTANSTAITKNGAGMMQVALAASGAVTLNAGEVQVGAGGTAGTVGNVTAAAGTVLSFNRSDDYAHAATIAGSGAVTQAGAGKLTLSAANSFSGGLTINGGTVALANATAGGAAGITAANNATLEVATGIAAAHTTLAGAGSLTKAGNGTLSLSGANTLAGNLSVNAGNLSLTGSASLGNAGVVGVGSGGTLAIGASVNDSQTGLITNAGTLTNAGVTTRGVTNTGTFANAGTAGTVTVSGGTVTNTGTLGAVTQSGGTLTSTGTLGAVTVTGGLARLSGTAGALTLGGTTVNVGGLNATTQLSASSLALQDGTTLDFEISDAGNTAFYDRLTLSGALDLTALTTSATLRLFSFDRTTGSRGNATAFNPYASFSIDLISAASVTGSTEFVEPLFSQTVQALQLDTTGFTNATSGSFALVATATGYRLDYTANIPVVTVDLAIAGVLADTTDGAFFLSELGNGQTAQVLRKVGAGQLTVNESLTHLGGTQIKFGSLLVADGASLGTGDVTIDAGASLQLANSGTFANSVSGAGDITKSGSGSLVLSGSVATTGNVTVQAGTLAGSFAPMAGTLQVASGAIVEFRDATGLTFSGQLAGAGTARLASGNTLTIGATNSGFTGAFAVDSGTLVLAATNALGTGTATIASGAIVNISGGISLASGLAGAGALTKTGAGTATLAGSVAHTGTTNVSAGTLKGDFTNASGAITVASGATLEYTLAADATRGGSDITGSGAFTKSGNGKLTLASALGVTGGVTVAAGTLSASDFGTASTVTINSGAVAELTLGSSSSLPTVFTGAGTLTKTGNTTLTVSATGLSTLAGKLRVTQGTVSTAAFGNLGTGSVELDGGALAVTASGQTFASGRNLIVGSSGARFDVSSLGQTGTTTIDAPVTGTGTLTLAGSGNTSANGGGDSGLGIRLTNAANSFTGDVVITSGLVSYTSSAVFGNTANKIVLNGGGLLDNNGNVALSRNIEVGSGGGVIRFWGGNSATWSGALSGTGALSRTDGGTLTHTGDLSGFTGTLNNLANSVTLFTGGSAGLGAATVNASSGTVGFASGRLGAATVNLDGGTLRFESDTTLAANAVRLVSGKTGYINTNGFNVTLATGVTGSGAGVDKNGAGVLSLQGAGTATLSGALNAYAGTLDVAGQTVSTSTAWVSGGTLKVSAGALTAGNYLMIGTGTLAITGGTLNAAWLRTGEGSGTSSTINQSGGTFNVTGTVIENERGNSFMLSHWNSGTTYNLSGGTLNVLGTNLAMGWDGTATINQSGGTANVRGINMATGRTNAAAYNLTGGRLNIGTGGITSATNKSVTFGNATVGALASWTGASAMSINAGTTVTFDTADSADGTTARTITLTGAIGGSGSLAKVGNGTLNLNAANTFSGALTASAGTINVNSTLRSVSGVTADSGAVVNFNATNFLTGGHGSAVADGVVLTAKGTGQIVMGSAMDARLGNITLNNGGTFTSNRGYANGYDVLLANTSLGAATVRVTGTAASAALMNGTGILHVQGKQNFNVADITGSAASDLTVSLALYDPNTSGGAAGGINKTGVGTMTLTSSGNAFSGDITVAAGTLEVGGSGRLNAGSYAGAIDNAGVLAFTSSANQTLSGVISGAGSLAKSGSGTLTVSGANTRTGATDITAGTLAVAATGSLGSGLTSVSNATLSVANGGSVGSGVVANNATLSFADSQTFSANVIAGAGGLTLATGANTVTFGTTLNGLGNLTKTGNGTLTLSGGGHTVAGAFNVAAGTVALSAVDAVTGAFNVASGATVAVNVNLASDAVFANALTGSGTLAITNAGTGVLSASDVTGFAAGRINLVSGSFDALGYAGRVGLLGGTLLNLDRFTGILSLGVNQTLEQEQALLAFTGTLELTTGGVTLDATHVNALANLVVGGGATLDFANASGAELTRAVTMSGNATLASASGYTGQVTLASGSNVNIGAGSLGGGTLVVASGATANITAPVANSVVFTGGTITGGASLSNLRVDGGTLRFGAGGNIDGFSASATLTVAGGTVNLADTGLDAAIQFNGGALTNAANYTGRLQIGAPAGLPAGQFVTFLMNGTIGGTVIAGDCTIVGGNGTFNELVMETGSNLSPGNSPGALTVGNLTLNGGSIWTVQVYSPEAVISSGPDANKRGYDTINIALPEGSFTNPVFDLSQVSLSSQVTLRLMTLSSWADGVGGTPSALLNFAPNQEYMDFVIATFGDGVLNLGGNASLDGLFRFDTAGFFDAAGSTVRSDHFEVLQAYNAATGLNELVLRYSAIPEPSTYGLMLGGLALAAAAHRRRKSARKA